MDGTALIYSPGDLQAPVAKTAHGLIRDGDRYRITSLINEGLAGREAGAWLDGKPRGIPIYATLAGYLANAEKRADFMVIGMANAGGKLDPAWLPDIERAIRAGMSIVCGMHEFLSDRPKLVQLAAEQGVTLLDLRRPPARDTLHFWTGKVMDLPCQIVPVLGTDCAVGKRTTTRLLLHAARAAGRKTELVYTGQTGWMQGGEYGFILDTTPNDFVSGELEHALLSCHAATGADWILVEGQGALRNPSGPCGSELLISGRADAVVLQHVPGRTYYKGWQHTGLRIPPLVEEIALIEQYGVPVKAVTINPQGMTPAAARAYCEAQQAELNRPVLLPLENDLGPVLEALDQPGPAG